MNERRVPRCRSRASSISSGGFRPDRAGFVLIIWGCLLLSATSCNASAWAQSAAGQDQFVEQLKLPRNPESTLQEVLSRPEFKDSDKESWIDKFRAWLSDVLKRISNWIWHRIPSPKWPEAELNLFWTVIGSFVVAAVLVVAAVVALSAIRSLNRTKYHEHVGEDLGLTNALASAELRTLAFKTAEQGNYREALINLFRYVLLWLDERGRLSVHQVKTNREVLESVRHDEPLRLVLAEMIPVFNRVRYGNYACDKREYEEFLAACRRVEDGA